MLGLAGNYKKINFRNLQISLKFALERYDLVDISTDYGIDFNLVDTIKYMNLSTIKSKFIYKVGCNYLDEYNANELAANTVKDINFFGLNRFNSLLLHRPSKEKLSSDVKYINFLKKEYPRLTIGISTNSIEIYNLYKQEFNIDIVQIALNPLDFCFNEPLINHLRKDNTSIQVRSVLSSGLLSGKYDKTKIFTDDMRSKFHTNENQDKYRKRIGMSVKIVDYLHENYNIKQSNIPIFLYSLFQDIANVDCVIRGGSSLGQMKKNLRTTFINDDIKQDIFKKMTNSWACDYV